MSSKKSGADLKISGLLNINKPQDITSRQVVDQVQKLIKPARVGHAGTLDPLATGVLVLCTGSNTRLIRFVQQQPKEYIGEFLLGKRSDTDDITGEISETADCRQVTLQELETCLPAFEGRIQQIPPSIPPFILMVVGLTIWHDVVNRLKFNPVKLMFTKSNYWTFHFPGFNCASCVAREPIFVPLVATWASN